MFAETANTEILEDLRREALADAARIVEQVIYWDGRLQCKPGCTALARRAPDLIKQLVSEELWPVWRVAGRRLDVVLARLKTIRVAHPKELQCPSCGTAFASGAGYQSRTYELFGPSSGASINEMAEKVELGVSGVRLSIVHHWSVKACA